MKTEDITVCIGAVVDRSDEVFEGGASVVRKLCEEDLRFFFCERAHPGDM
jgi:hypothetical protein